MEKPLALVLPDRPGVLREIMRILSACGVTVQRMSYNRVIDIHALFLDVWGTTDAIAAAENELRAWRFFPGQRASGEVVLLEFPTGDNLAVLEPVLALVERHELNITYLDVLADSGPSDKTQIGVYVRDRRDLDGLLADMWELCAVRVVPSNERPTMLDNNHFNLSFAHGLAKRLGLSEADEEEVLINSNRIMQNLMHDGADPYKPFDFINQWADMLALYHGTAFAANARVSRFQTAGGVACTSIEPPVGSTSWIFECDDRLLCVDAGYCCYATEFEALLRDLYPDWCDRVRDLVLTHGDIDHMGAWALFDHVYASGRVIDGFSFEALGIVNWREQSHLSFPYIRLGNVLSGYRTPDFASMVCLGEPSPMGAQKELFKCIDTLEVAPLTFEVWEGKGGHVRGETVLIERTQRVCVSGDIFVNVHGETKPQMQFNALAPYLMTSVDSIPELAREERTALMGLLGPGTWQIMGGHGCVYEYDGPYGKGD